MPLGDEVFRGDAAGVSGSAGMMIFMV